MSDHPVEILFHGLTSLFGQVVGRRRRRRIWAAWQAVASQLGLQVVSRDARGFAIGGTLRDQAVRMTLVPKSRQLDRAVLTAQLATPLPPNFRLASRVGTTPLSSGPLDADLAQAFDAQGDLTTITALLSAAARRPLQRLAGDWLAVERGEARLELDAADCEVDRLVDRLRALAALAQALDLGAQPVPLRLAVGVRQEPEPPARALRLRLLVEGWPTAELTARTLAHAASDPAVEVQLEAALLTQTTAALVAIAVDGQVPDGLRVRAVEGLIAASAEALPTVLAPVLQCGGGAAWRCAVVWCGQRGLDALLQTIAPAALAADDHAALAASLAPRPVPEDVLFALLAGSGAGPVVEALGERGTHRAIGPLRAVTGPDRKAAQHAITRIQRRMGTGLAGGLAIAGAGDGALALADEPPE